MARRASLDVAQVGSRGPHQARARQVRGTQPQGIGKRMTWLGAQCPICGATVPVFEITAKGKGFLRRNVEVNVTGDATDFVAHIWTHQEDAWQKR